MESILLGLLISIFLIGILIFDVLCAINTRDNLEINRKILTILQEISDATKLDIPEDTDNSNVELVKFAQEGLDNEDEDEKELPESLRAKMSRSTSLWEEDALEPKEVEQL